MYFISEFLRSNIFRISILYGDKSFRYNRSPNFKFWKWLKSVKWSFNQNLVILIFWVVKNSFRLDSVQCYGQNWQKYFIIKFLARSCWFEDRYGNEIGPDALKHFLIIQKGIWTVQTASHLPQKQYIQIHSNWKYFALEHLAVIVAR